MDKWHESANTSKWRFERLMIDKYKRDSMKVEHINGIQRVGSLSQNDQAIDHELSTASVTRSDFSNVEHNHPTNVSSNSPTTPSIVNNGNHQNNNNNTNITNNGNINYHNGIFITSQIKVNNHLPTHMANHMKDYNHKVTIQRLHIPPSEADRSNLNTNTNTNTNIEDNKYDSDNNNTNQDIYNSVHVKSPSDISNSSGDGLPDTCALFESIVELVYVYYVSYLLIPTLILSHIYSVLYPIISLITIIKCEIVANDFRSHSIDNGLFLPCSLTMIYIVIIILWIIFVIKSFNYYFWTMFLFPNSIENDCWDLSKGTEYGIHCHLLNTIQGEYDRRCRLIFLNHKRRQILAQVLDFDCAAIVVSFLPKCKFELDKMLDSIDATMVRHINQAQMDD